MKNTPRLHMLVWLIGALVISSCTQSQAPKAANAEDKPIVQSHQLDTTGQVTANTVDSTHLLGVWFDETIKSPEGGNVAYQVIAHQQRVFIQPIAFKGKKLQVSDQPVVSPYATELKKNGNYYVSLESPEDAYEVDKEGNLLIFHKGKLVVVCKKIL